MSETTSPPPERPGNRKTVDKPPPTTNMRDGKRNDAAERWATGSKPPPDA
jgi:hypothetical protein